jgi:hypothetical protein
MSADMTAEQMGNVMAEQMVGRLSVINNGCPYIIPVHYLYENGKIYFHSSKKGLKISCIKQNPAVCFEVDELIGIQSGESACRFHTRYRSVLLNGSARILEDDNEKAVIIDRLVWKYANGRQLQAPTEEAIRNVAIVEIEVQEMTGKCRED